MPTPLVPSIVTRVQMHTNQCTACIAWVPANSNRACAVCKPQLTNSPESMHTPNVQLKRLQTLTSVDIGAHPYEGA